MYWFNKVRLPPEVRESSLSVQVGRRWGKASVPYPSDRSCTGWPDWRYGPLSSGQIGAFVWAHNNIATLLYSPWEKILIQSHSKVSSSLSEVQKGVSIL